MEKFNKKPYIIGSIIFLVVFGGLCVYRKFVKKNIVVPAQSISIEGQHRHSRKRKSHPDVLEIAPTGAQ